ncbi:hypothetical protein B0A50_00749 [Salinomyces thailandicus]|uniref:Nitrogen permease regulator 2 n=1 Tax=Salinomyces thailandicus TaxID=706561 RepID=A0A4U0UF09_9PEZI|nr:hypothetical protein B0A50_00749 [Salinomyces thailandica]
MLKAVFYARFHLINGPSIIHQYPQGSVIPQADHSGPSAPLLSFSDISAYIIPPYELCNQSLSICTNGHRVLGFPISLEDVKYDRNRFTFSVCFVLDEQADPQPWEQAVKKTAACFQALEEEDGLLQAEEELSGLKWAGDDGYPADDVGIVHTLLAAIVQDMNAYRETCIRIDDTHVLNLRLTQPRPAPPKVHPWQVPLLIRALPSPEEWTWDLTLQRIHPHLNGVNPIQRIAETADVELKLVQRAIRELLYYDRVVLLDLFHYQAIYALTPDFTDFVADHAMQRECLDYILTGPAPAPAPAPTPTQPQPKTFTPQTLIDLYCALSPGLTLRDFLLLPLSQPHFQNAKTKTPQFDIRRFITFGTIKGFVRRIHKHALAISTTNTTTTSPPHAPDNSTPSTSPTKPRPKLPASHVPSNEALVKEFDRAWRKAALSSGWATPPSVLPPSPAPIGAAEANNSYDSAEAAREHDSDEKLAKFLDGKHCLDEMCMALRMSERKVVERMRSGRFGEVVLFNK